MKAIRDTYRHLPAQERPRFALAVAGFLAWVTIALLTWAGLLAELGRVWAGWWKAIF